MVPVKPTFTTCEDPVIRARVKTLAAPASGHCHSIMELAI
jgi:hypothetical protein